MYIAQNTGFTFIDEYLKCASFAESDNVNGLYSMSHYQARCEFCCHYFCLLIADCEFYLLNLRLAPNIQHSVRVAGKVLYVPLILVAHTTLWMLGDDYNYKCEISRLLLEYFREMSGISNNCI